jgi:hypothetical protein
VSRAVVLYLYGNDEKQALKNPFRVIPAVDWWWRNQENCKMILNQLVNGDRLIM